MPTQHVAIIVDCDRDAVQKLQMLLNGVAVTESYADFASARKKIVDSPPDFLVTNLRLGAYNGLHLVQLARARSSNIRCLVYDRAADRGLAKVVQQTGAFFEPYDRLPATLASYLSAELPSVDRRDPEQGDRRRIPRAGRRSSDARTS